MAELNWNVVKSEIFYRKGSSNENSEYLFKSQLEQIKEYVNLVNKDNCSISKNNNKIIGIIGERGSGKSSLLGTVSNHLDEDYIVFKTINPSILNVKISIIELFLSEMYKEVVDYTKGNNNDLNMNPFDDSLKDDRRIILNKLKEITKMFSNLNNNEEFRKETPSLDVLNNIAEITSFDEKLVSLIESFIGYVNKKYNNSKKEIVICIDDLDLVPNNEIYSILEDIQKYLSKNVIVIIAYRGKQLYDSVMHKKVQENSVLSRKNEHLIGQYIDGNEIKNQTSKYIEKFIPSSQKIYLLDNSQVLNKPIVDFLLPLVETEDNDIAKRDKITKVFITGYSLSTDSKISNKITVSDWLYSAIKIKTKIDLKPVDKKEESEYILPSNIRGMFHFIEIIHENMKAIDNKDINNLENHGLDDLIGNIQFLKNTLASSAKERFSEKDQNLYEQWEIADYSSKNYVIYENLFWRINDSEGKKLNIYPKENLDSLLRITEIQTYNISIGDVYSILEEYKKVSDNEIEKIYFIYCLKIFYSILLLDLYLTAAQERNNNNIYLERYLLIINAKIMPDDFVYFGISTYEKNIDVRFESYYKLNKNKKNNLSFIEKITYSDVSVGGEVRVLNRAKLENTYTKGKYDIFKYRYFFNYEELFLINGTQYLYDPFTFMTKKIYVKETIEQLGIKNNYIFYSLFDIDIFVRINYTRQSQQNESDLKYSLRKINKIFNKKFNFNIKNKNEIEYLQRLNGFVFETTDNEPVDIYSEEELEFSDVFFNESVILKKEDIVNKKENDSVSEEVGLESFSYDHKLTKAEYENRINNLIEKANLTVTDSNKLAKITERLRENSQSRPNKKEQFVLYQLQVKYNTIEE